MLVFQSLWLFVTPWKPSRLLCPWNSPGKNTGVDSHSLLQGLSLIQGSNPGSFFTTEPPEIVPQTKDYGQPPEAAKARETDSLLEFPEETQLITGVTQWDPFQIYDPQNCKIINFCCFKPLNFGNLLQQTNADHYHDFAKTELSIY